MKKALFIILLGFAVFIMASPSVFAAKSSGGKTSTAGLGIDISYPQCNKTVPKTQAFGIVGINGGLATTTNPCLKDQLAWANKSLGGTSQEKLQVYVNTANPGGLGTSSWPSNGTSVNPYGDCNGEDSLSCAWQYGWNRAYEDVVDRFIPAAGQAKINSLPSAYFWWLDVETLNTWKPTTSEFNSQSNSAVIEGMAAHLQSIGARVGLYSTAKQWHQIVGNSVDDNSNLNGLPNWRPGGANLSTAKQACNAEPLTPGGKIVLSQFIYKNLDYNFSCI